MDIRIDRGDTCTLTLDRRVAEELALALAIALGGAGASDTMFGKGKGKSNGKSNGKGHGSIYGMAMGKDMGKDMGKSCDEDSWKPAEMTPGGKGAGY